MPSFTDNENREWSVVITGRGVNNIRSQLGINIADGFDVRKKEKRNVLEEIGEDFTLLFDILYVLCREQCDKQNISGDQFADALFGDAIEHATTALLEALCDFFPSQKRKVLRALIDRLKEKRPVLTDEEIRTAANKIVDSVMNPSSASSTSLPESAA